LGLLNHEFWEYLQSVSGINAVVLLATLSVAAVALGLVAVQAAYRDLRKIRVNLMHHAGMRQTRTAMSLACVGILLGAVWTVWITAIMWAR
jgi:hypothetical protein